MSQASSTPASMGYVFSALFRLHCFYNLDCFISYFPGLWNETADALSRGHDDTDSILHSRPTGRDPLALAHLFINFNFTKPCEFFLAFSSKQLRVKKVSSTSNFTWGLWSLRSMSSISFGFQNPLFHFVWLTHLVFQTVYVLLVPRTFRNALVVLTKFFATQKAVLCGNCLGVS